MATYPNVFATQAGGPGTTVDMSKLDANFQAGTKAPAGPLTAGNIMVFADINGNEAADGGAKVGNAANSVPVLDGSGLLDVTVLNLHQITAALGADVALTPAVTYKDGPSVAQGTSGTWYVSGTVTINKPDATADFFDAKLWDGTTVIASATIQVAGTSPGIIALSGIITSPAGNLRISVQAETSTSASIAFNRSGNSKDSSITALRIR